MSNKTLDSVTFDVEDLLRSIEALDHELAGKLRARFTDLKVRYLSIKGPKGQVNVRWVETETL